MNDKYVTKIFLPLLGQSIIAILVVYIVSSYFEWQLDWFIAFYIILLIHYVQKVYKFRYKQVRDRLLVIVSVCSTSIAIPLYWIIYKNTQKFEGLLFQLLSLGLYIMVFSLLWLFPYLFGSDQLKEQLGKTR